VEDFSVERLLRLRPEELEERFNQFRELTTFEPVG
jgi:hypothetical protein